MRASLTGASGTKLVPHLRATTAMSLSTSTTDSPCAAKIVLASAAHTNNRVGPLVATGAATASERRIAPTAIEHHSGSVARWGMAAVYLMLAYEWLLSGLSKDLSGTYRSGLASRVHGSLVNNPHGWYVSLVERVVLPQVGLFAVAVALGEVLVAAGLIWGALLWVRPGWFPVGLRLWLAIAVSAALLGAALMDLNYYLLAGQGWPWLKTSDPFIESLSIDGLMLLISLTLIPVQLLAARQEAIDGPATDA